MSTSAGGETIPGQPSLLAPALYLGLIPCALAEAELLASEHCLAVSPFSSVFPSFLFCPGTGPCTESHLDGHKALHRKDQQQLPPRYSGSCQEMGCFDFLSREVQTPEGRNVVYCILILFLQSWTVPCMKIFLETRSRNDDFTRQCCVTRQCCPLPHNTLPVTLKLSALLVLYKEWKFLLVLRQSGSPGLSVSVTVNMCFPRFTLLSCRTALCLCCCTEGATTSLPPIPPSVRADSTPGPRKGWRSQAEPFPHPLVRTWEHTGRSPLAQTLQAPSTAAPVRRRMELASAVPVPSPPSACPAGPSLAPWAPPPLPRLPLVPGRLTRGAVWHGAQAPARLRRCPGRARGAGRGAGGRAGRPGPYKWRAAPPRSGRAARGEGQWRPGSGGERRARWAGPPGTVRARPRRAGGAPGRGAGHRAEERGSQSLAADSPGVAGVAPAAPRCALLLPARTSFPAPGAWALCRERGFGSTEFPPR